MKTVSINGREYPFHVSPAAAKKLTQMIINRSSKATEENYDKESGKWKDGKQSEVASEIVRGRIDLNIETLYLGMKHARIALPLSQRLWLNIFRPIPSRKRLEIILPNEELDKLVGAEAMPEPTEVEKEEESEKKH